MGSRIWIVQLPGGKPYPIRGTRTFQDAPTWSPKGDWIAYLEGTSLVKAEVGGLKDPVTLLEAGRIPAFVARPQWSPNGKWILCETLEGLSLVPAEQPGEPRVIGEGTWFVYAWDADSRRIYGLRPADNGHDVMLVSLDSQTREERVISTNLGTWTQALQPVRGFSRLKNGGFLTSISRARSDIYLLEEFRLPRTWWQRLWPFTGNPDARR
jgi:Tol biopolymer transport system component